MMIMSQKLFSVRNRLAPDAPGQAGVMDEKLRNSLWNVILSRLFGKVGANQYGEISQDYHIFINLQRNFFKLPMDELEKHLGSRREWYKDIFFAMEWWQVYDLFEFVARRMIPFDAQEWERDTNLVLEAERTPYRLVSGSVVPCAEDASFESLRDTIRLLEAQQGMDLPAAACAELKAALAALALRPDADLKALSAACSKSIELICSFVSPDALDGVSASGPQLLSRVINDAEVCRPEWLQKAAAQVFVTHSDPAGSDTIAIQDAPALVGLASIVIGSLLRHSARLGRIELALPQAPRPTAPDPWGERHLVSGSRD
jgi:AbiJ N-terminal domain 4